MKFPEELEIEMTVTIHFSLTFWEAFKVRLAGKAAQELIHRLAERIIQDEDEVTLCNN